MPTNPIPLTPSPTLARITSRPEPSALDHAQGGAIQMREPDGGAWRGSDGSILVPHLTGRSDGSVQDQFRPFHASAFVPHPSVKGLEIGASSDTSAEEESQGHVLGEQLHMGGGGLQWPTVHRVCCSRRKSVA